MNDKRLILRGCVSLLILLLLAAGCRGQPATPEAATPTAIAPTATAPAAAPTETMEPVSPPTPAAVASATVATVEVPPVVAHVRFAPFAEPPVSTQPLLAHEPVAPDLGNVRVGFALSDEQRARLAEDGFVVSPGMEKEFFTLYEKARYNNEPIFVTSDSLLHVYHLLFDKVLRTAESDYFIPLLRDLNAAMLAELDAQYQDLQSTPWEDAARRSVAFAGVASRLLDPAVRVPDYAEALVEAELALVEEAGGMQPSPLFPGLEFGEDYTQYIPRGHYTRSEALEAYFRSMMWYGRMTFRLKTDDPEVGRAESRAAVLVVRALRNAEVRGRPAQEAWMELYEPTVFFVGRSDDLTVLQYQAVMDAVYGPDVAASALVDEAKLDQFIEAANQLPPPAILGIVIQDTDDVEATTKGLRFMGQRFVPDAYIFRQLIYRNVGTRENPRLLPRGLDIMAALGSERAYEILDEMGETAYVNYPEQMAKARGWVSGLSIEEWTETLYNSWLYTFLPLLEEPAEGVPAFMQSQAWQDKQLNTTLGSWAELKHDTILYAKQVYAEMGAGPMPPEPVPPLGYVEPVPYFYARLHALTAMTREGLAQRDLLGDLDASSLERLEEITREFQTMAEKELRGEPLTEEEQYTIRFWGGELEHLTMAAAAEGDEAGNVMEEEPQAAVVADVATAPDTPEGPVVLEVAVGRINVIHVVVPVTAPDGSTYLQVAKGGVFSYYEFPWPASDRLTDEKWRAMLDGGKAPPLPEWTDSFVTMQGEYSVLTEAIFAIQRWLTIAYWDGVFPGPAEGAAPAQIEALVAPLQEANQFAGHQLVSSEFRSFDRQSEETAVVTVRETWQDELYDRQTFDFTPLATRGPYTLDVTYTLEQGEEGWVVTNIVYANELPGWETVPALEG
jgi:hypothetical protein